MNNGTDLTTFTQSDGTMEQYYSGGDKFLTKAFALLVSYWNYNAADTSLYMTQGGLDTYLPIQLRDLKHNAANAMEQRLGEHVSESLSPLGLVPYYAHTFQDSDNNYLSANNKQHVDFAIHASELLSWTDSFRRLAEQVCGATKTRLDFSGGGVFPWADATTGAQAGRITGIEYIAQLVAGMIVVSDLTGDSQYLQWADQKIDFVWAQRPNSWLNILADKLTPDDFVPSPTSGTDTLYYVRRLFEAWKVLEGKRAYQQYADKYRTQALAVAHHWIANNWRPEFGHFSGKVLLKTDPPISTKTLPTSIYGDGKWNTLFILVWAYRATSDANSAATYLALLKTAWENLLKMSTTIPGLVDGRFISGVGSGYIDEAPPASVSSSPSSGQINFLDVLLTAYEATSDPYFLVQAVALGENMLAHGEVVFLSNTGLPGAVFLRLAQAHSTIRRLQINMGARNRLITIKSERNEKPELGTVVTADIAIVYLPQDRYAVSVENHSKNVALDSDVIISFP
jgi:hypothetical protein